jgi:WD40 repeat protein
MGPPLDADPLPAVLQAPVDPKGTVPLPVSKLKNTWVNVPAWYSWQPSPLVVLESVKASNRWDVWNMQSMKQIGMVPRKSGEQIFISPDGGYAAREYYPPGKVTPRGAEVFKVPDGQLIRNLPAHFSTDSRIGTTDFIGPDQFLALHAAGRDGRAKLWDVKSGEQLGEFTTHGAVSSKQIAISPGGLYLATCETAGPTAGVYVYEMPSGKMVRKFKAYFNPPTSYHMLQALAFSYDGKQLALLAANDKGKDVVQSWDFTTGKRTANHNLNTSLAQTAAFYSPALQWLPDSTGWLAYGQFMIDRQRGNIFWKVPFADPKHFWQRRFVDADHLVSVQMEPAPWHVGIVTLPRDQITAARRK